MAEKQKQSLERILENKETLSDIFKILNQEQDMVLMLDSFMDRLLSVSWLNIHYQGAVFLVHGEEKVLTLVSSKFLNPALHTICSKVKFGQCLCGLAAEQKKTYHTSCLNDKQSNRFPGMKPHGHYNIPIMRADKVLGVVVFYLEDGKERDEEEILFLEDAVGVLSLVLQSKIANQQLQERDTRLRAVLENAAEGFITIDSNGIIQDFNQECENIFGYKFSEVVNKNVDIIIPEPHKTAHDDYLKNYQKTGEKKVIDIRREVEGLRKDGSIFPLDLSVSEIQVNGQVLYFGILRDTSERKKMEQELERSNQELEKFAFVASHDLKAPLRHITYCSEFIEEDLREKLTEETQGYLDTMKTSAKRMGNMIDSLLEYSRINSKYVMEKQPVDLNDVFKNVIEDLHVAIQETGAVIDCDVLPTVMGDKALFGNLFLNVLQNAMKYIDEGETPKILVSVKECETEYIIAITDNGIGIKPEFLDKIFEIFQRLHRDDEYQGIGIGLPTCRKVIEYYGGRIWLDTNCKDGSRFYLSFLK